MPISAKRARECARQKKERLENPRKYREQYLKQDRDKRRAQARAWYARNREQQRARTSQWSKKNRVCKRHIAMKRHAMQVSATPAWLTAVHNAQIQEMYEIAEALNIQTRIEHHVDHVFPLRGKGFNGLHVPWNLQVLTEEQNRAKKNLIPAHYSHLFWKAA